MRKFVCDAVLLDMDGTLVDSTAVVVRMWTCWATRHGLPLESIMAVSHGRRTVETIREVAPHLDAALEAATFQEEERADREGIFALPGGIDFVEQLPADRWAVVTSADRRLAEIRLRQAGFPLPVVMITAEDVSAGKPDPQGYLLAASRLSVEPGRCLVFEDAPAGIKAGLSAGMQVIGITSTHPPEALIVDSVTADFRFLSLDVGIDGFITVTMNPALAVG